MVHTCMGAPVFYEFPAMQKRGGQQGQAGEALT